MHLTLEVTERDKKLLKILAVVVVIGLFFLIVFRPLLNSISSMQSELDQAEQEKVVMEQEIAQLATNESSLDSIKSQTYAAASDFYDLDKNSTIDKTLTELANEHGLTVSNLNIDVDPSAANITAYDPLTAASGSQSDDSEESDSSSSPLQVTRTTMDVTGSQADFLKMLDTIFHKEKSMHVVSYSTSSNVLFSVNRQNVESSTMEVVLDIYMYDKSGLE